MWYAQDQVDTLPRLRGTSKHRIQYRHIIDWLVRKPGSVRELPLPRGAVSDDSVSNGVRPVTSTLYVVKGTSGSRLAAIHYPIKRKTGRDPSLPTKTASRFYPGRPTVGARLSKNLVSRYAFRIHPDGSRETKVLRGACTAASKPVDEVQDTPRACSQRIVVNGG